MGFIENKKRVKNMIKAILIYFEATMRTCTSQRRSNTMLSTETQLVKRLLGLVRALYHLGSLVDNVNLYASRYLNCIGPNY